MLFNVIGGALIGNGAVNLFMHRGLGTTGSIVEIVIGLALAAYRFHQLFTER